LQKKLKPIVVVAKQAKRFEEERKNRMRRNGPDIQM